jgi:alcohol dehydrogenase
VKTNFYYFMPTRLIFGPGELKRLAGSPYLPGKKALVVIGAGGAMRRHGYLDEVFGYLAKSGCDTVLYDKILPNPVLAQVNEGAGVARENWCDFVLGLGGGSTIDAAKAIALTAANAGNYWDYIQSGTGGRKPAPQRALPIVAIPTTAGTGTEADPWTVITKPATREKIGWGRDDTFPGFSIVDPELMVSVPPKTTAYTGMDAFFHAVEAYLARVSQPNSDLLALEAIGLIAKYLPVAVQDGGNREARTALAWASTAAGICESLSSCISHHSMEHALSAFYPEIPHGAGLTMLSRAYFAFLAQKHPLRFPELARAMGGKNTQGPQAFLAALERLIAGVGLANEAFSGYGVQREDIRPMAENALQTMGGLFYLTPVKLSVDDVVKIYADAYR